MVARRPADGAPLAIGLAHRGEEVVGAANLERAGALQALGLDEQATAQLGIHARILEQRRADGDAFEAAGGGLYVGKGRKRGHHETPSSEGRKERSLIWPTSLPGRMSSGRPPRFTQSVRKPNCAAPCASQQFEERKQTLSAVTPVRFLTSS